MPTQYLVASSQLARAPYIICEPEYLSTYICNVHMSKYWPIYYSVLTGFFVHFERRFFCVNRLDVVDKNNFTGISTCLVLFRLEFLNERTYIMYVSRQYPAYKLYILLCTQLHVHILDLSRVQPGSILTYVALNHLEKIH